MYNLERLPTLGTRDTGRRQTNKIKPKQTKRNTDQIRRAMGNNHTIINNSNVNYI